MNGKNLSSECKKWNACPSSCECMWSLNFPSRRWVQNRSSWVDNLLGLIKITIVDGLKNGIKKLERITHESLSRWCSHVGSMSDDRTVERTSGDMFEGRRKRGGLVKRLIVSVSDVMRDRGIKWGCKGNDCWLYGGGVLCLMMKCEWIVSFTS